MSNERKRVVIVGGGFGGVKTALELANKPGFSVQLISSNTHFEYHGALYRSAVGHSPKEVVIPLAEIFEDAKNVEVVLDQIGYVDDKKKLVVGADGDSYQYDKLVLALGNQMNYFGIEGLKEYTETMHDIGSTLRLRRKLIDIFSKKQRVPVRIAIVGGGATGVELAGEIPFFAQLVAKRHNLPKPKVRVVLVEASDRLLPNLKPEASQKVAKRLVKLGIEIYLKIAVESCEDQNLCLSAGNLNADLLIWTAGSKPVDFYTVNSHIFTLGRGGRVAVDEYLHPQGHTDIYVIGDNADTEYSGMAQTALHDALFVAKNLLSKQAKKYRPKKPLYVVTAGGKWAVVQKGNKVISGLRGWRIRRQADLAIFKNFEPYEKAIKTWQAGNRTSKSV